MNELDKGLYDVLPHQIASAEREPRRLVAIAGARCIRGAHDEADGNLGIGLGGDTLGGERCGRLVFAKLSGIGCDLHEVRDEPPRDHIFWGEARGAASAPRRSGRLIFIEEELA